MKNLIAILLVVCVLAVGCIGFLEYKSTADRAPVEEPTELIVEQEGRSISQIFAEDGEAGFREIETTILRGIGNLSGNGLIISTGGGIVTTPENIPLLKKAGTVVWLRVKPETVIRRLAGDTTRPLLAGDNPEEKVRDLMEKRKDMYAQAADEVIDVDSLSIDDIVKKVLQFRSK